MRRIFMTACAALLLFVAASAQPASGADFGLWHVDSLDSQYVRLWTQIPDTDMEFEIFLPKNQGYRYYETRPIFQVDILRMVDTAIYKKYYQTPDNVKDLGSFMLDEVIYPVGLDNMDHAGHLVTYVDDLPDDFLDLLTRCQILMFRQVSGAVYSIFLDGFNEALAYARSLLRDYDDPSSHPCYPLLYGNRHPCAPLLYGKRHPRFPLMCGKM